MGKVLIIKGANFSQNAIVKSTTTTAISIEQGVISLVIGTASGNYSNTSDGNHTKRLRAVRTGLISIEAGATCTISGLQGDGTVLVLRPDAAIYSSADSPSHSTFLHSLNGDTNDYYKFNEAGNDSYTFTAPYTGYYAFCFAGPNKTEVVSPSNYSLEIEISQ